jgi:hypothetical protein
MYQSGTIPELENKDAKEERTYQKSKTKTKVKGGGAERHWQLLAVAGPLGSARCVTPAG